MRCAPAGSTTPTPPPSRARCWKPISPAPMRTAPFASPPTCGHPTAVPTGAGAEAAVIWAIPPALGWMGAVRSYDLAGKPMPRGWVQDRKDGSPITDPRRINEGAYLPMGGYKGGGLSIIIGLLAGPLNGAAFGRDIRDFAAPPDGELNVGQFVIALDVARFVPPDVFKAEVDRHIRE